MDLIGNISYKKISISCCQSVKIVPNCIRGGDFFHFSLHIFPHPNGGGGGGGRVGRNKWTIMRPNCAHIPQLATEFWGPTSKKH